MKRFLNVVRACLVVALFIIPVFAMFNTVGSQAAESETNAVKKEGQPHKQTAGQIAREAKARSDAIKAAKKQIDVLVKQAEIIKSIGADELKFAKEAFDEKMKLPCKQIAEMEKNIAETKKMMEEVAKTINIRKGNQ